MDPILYWNDVALEANRISHTNGKNEQTGPTLSSRALAIVHLAMYDAYFGVTGDYGDGMDKYLPDLPTFPGTGGNVVAAAAAVAAAAHATLSYLFPSQKDFFDRKHLEAGLQGADIAAGHAYGLAVAQCILEDRKDDPDASDKGYAPSMARGAHRPDPDNPAQGYHAPFYGAKSKGFAVSARHTLLPPPKPHHDPKATPDPRYTRAFREVYGLGIAPELMGTLPNDVPKRTADQTLTGIYWGYDGAMKLGTPPRLYNLIIRKAFESAGYTPAQNARLFALVNVAMGDAGILAWDQKYIHNLWRPVVGIREHAPSMGPAGTAATGLEGLSDPGWLPLGAPNTNAAWELAPQMSAYPCGHVLKGIPKNVTPHFPAYPSGHATFGAAAFHIAWLYFNRDNKGAKKDPFENLEFVSEEFNGISQDNKGTVRPRHVRKFPKGMSQLIEENGRSRVYLGVHWVFDAFAVNEKNEPLPKENIGGVPLGTKIADDIFEKKMKKSTVKPRKCNGKEVEEKKNK